MKNNLKMQLISIFSICILSAIIASYMLFKPSDQEAYNEVIATMSMDKAKRFFHNHPDSDYKDMLVSEIIKWCQHENKEESYRMALETIPMSHIKYEELQDYYNKYFRKANE